MFHKEGVRNIKHAVYALYHSISSLFLSPPALPEPQPALQLAL